MDSIFEEEGRQASTMRKAFRASHGVEVSYNQMLDLLAQGRNAKDWNEYAARKASTWFTQRHASYVRAAVEPYAPEGSDSESLSWVFSLSAQNAVAEELMPFLEFSNPHGASFSRMFTQMSLIRAGTFKVDPLLERALNADKIPLAERANRAGEARANFETVANRYPEQLHSEAYQKSYHQAYCAHLCAQLAVKHQRLIQHPERSFFAYRSRGIDCYSLLAAPLYWNDLSVDKLEAMSYEVLREKLDDVRELSKAARVYAKGLLLRYLGGATNAPLWAQAPMHMLIPHLFPDIDVWLCWVQLKPLLAKGIDQAYASWYPVALNRYRDERCATDIEERVRF
jgi:hypothetical protein